MARALETGAKKQVAKIQDYKRLFSGEDGKKVLRDLIKNFQMLDSTFNPKGDGLEMAYLEGQRSVILHILGKINTDADQLQKFMEEAINEKPIFALTGV